MTNLLERLKAVVAEPLPLPGGGQTSDRHAGLFALGREDLSLARLAEAHFDAIAILAEAGRSPVRAEAIYGVWASEIPGHPLTVERSANELVVSGKKHFCSGAGSVDRALLTLGNGYLADINLRDQEAQLVCDDSKWITIAFAETKTATVTFKDFVIPLGAVVGQDNWYLTRAGFWHGACGPAACWAGGAVGLYDFALRQTRSDPHTLAHLGALGASAWMMQALLEKAGEYIDAAPLAVEEARTRALMVRHLIEEHATDMLRRLARAYGPHPLAMHRELSQRYSELDLYLRQCHAERDLESLGRDLKERFQQTVIFSR